MVVVLRSRGAVMKGGRVVFDDGEVSISGGEGFRGSRALALNINPRYANMKSG